MQQTKYFKDYFPTKQTVYLLRFITIIGTGTLIKLNW